ncbi:hypothetical protein FGB62_134g013 [Gracilaria domingensis]|nr:hypothetical protein FGB62_134g013 [Gracilaria domingensis]
MKLLNKLRSPAAAESSNASQSPPPVADPAGARLLVGHMRPVAPVLLAPLGHPRGADARVRRGRRRLAPLAVQRAARRLHRQRGGPDRTRDGARPETRAHRRRQPVHVRQRGGGGGPHVRGQPAGAAAKLCL